MAARAKTDPNVRLTAELLEMAKDMHAHGIMDDTAYEKITMRHIALAKDVFTTAPVSANDIRRLRQDARMSQAVFAHHLNLTAGYVSQLERGAKQPTGAALALLNVIKRKGIEAVLS
ncbi:MAG: helix-turn-helix domain-containing protein [Beijerinckiaceae bacterium]